MNQHPAVLEGKRLLSRIGITAPIYVVDATSTFLSSNERRYLFMQPGEWIAFTAPIADVMFSRGALRYEWEGRGFCCVFRQSPLTLGVTQTIATMIHEAGHYIEYENCRARDDSDVGRAAKEAFNGGNREQHGPRWLRATTHLWWRALVDGYNVPLENVMNPEQYGFKREHVNALLPEAQDREGESIEAIVNTPLPAAFQRLGGKSVKRKSKPAKPRRRATTATQRRQPAATTATGVAILCGQVVETLPCGGVRTVPRLDGTGGGEYFASSRAFIDATDRRDDETLAKRERLAASQEPLMVVPDTFAGIR